MKCRFLFLIVLVLMVYPGKAQQRSVSREPASKPKLVVGLVVDQMRWDYLYRFRQQYSRGGFNRMMKEGFSCENTMISHLPTYTAVGHTGVYTGSVPAFHGIVANYWYDKSIKNTVYCSDDSTVTGVGSNTIAGKMSPVNMWTNTITDELRLSNQFQSKVIGISLKDRGAIFPAGHSANAAYWYDEYVGKWISSTYYMKELPQWVNDFNARDRVTALMTQDWNTLLPIADYKLSDEDVVPYESHVPGEEGNGFPHRLSAIKAQKNSAIRYTPHGNTYTLEFAKATIQKESLGKGTATDFLAVSLSSTDYAGHEFGPNSIELQDMYLRLDLEFAAFFSYLDSSLGKGNYLVFLTADHGAAHVSGFLQKNKMPAGIYSESRLGKEINDMVEEKFGFKKAVAKFDNSQVYLQLAELKKEGKDTDSIIQSIKTFLMAKPFITDVQELDEIAEATIAEPVKSRIINSYTPKRCGDLQVFFKAGYMDRDGKGTTHGMWNPYDAHIPLVWMGWGIKPGKTHRETYMTDIAATLAALLNIQMPNGCVGKVITEIIP